MISKGTSFVLAAALVGLLSMTAEARVKGPRVTSISYACGKLQDRWDQLLNEVYRKDYDYSNITEIQAELKSIARQWEDGCSKEYGKISSRAIPLLDGKPRKPSAGASGGQKLKK